MREPCPSRVGRAAVPCWLVPRERDRGTGGTDPVECGGDLACAVARNASGRASHGRVPQGARPAVTPPAPPRPGCVHVWTASVTALRARIPELRAILSDD